MKKLSEHSLRFALYSSFSISNQTTDFRLSLGKYSGNKGDAFRSHEIIGHKFSTYDHDYNTCAKQCGSGWWYNRCTLVNLNAPFFENHHDPVWKNYISVYTIYLCMLPVWITCVSYLYVLTVCCRRRICPVFYTAVIIILLFLFRTLSHN